MKTTKEQRKEKAIELLTKLDIFTPYINGFKSKATKVCFFENYGGFWLHQEEEIAAKVKEFEENSNGTVYAVTHEYTEFGELWDFLYVPEEEEDWTDLVMESAIPRQYYTFAYSYNSDTKEGESGDILVRSYGGGIKRIG